MLEWLKKWYFCKLLLRHDYKMEWIRKPKDPADTHITDKVCQRCGKSLGPFVA